MIRFENNSAYTFSTHPPAITTKFRNCIAMGVVTYQIANAYADIQALHSQYFPYLPEGTPDDPTILEYLLVKLDSGKDTVVCTAWIKEETVTRADSFPLQILLPNVSPSDITRIRDMLVVNNFTGFQLKVANTQEVL